MDPHESVSRRRERMGFLFPSPFSANSCEGENGFGVSTRETFDSLDLDTDPNEIKRT